MTRLIPTRDRAQATVFTLTHDVVMRLLREWQFTCVTSHREGDGWIIEVPASHLNGFWSGPWYVREVAE